MDYTIREMQANEIPLIVGIDRSEDLSEEYVCAPADVGLGLKLVRRRVNPPREVPNWSQQELESRFSLWRKNLQDGAVLFGAFQEETLIGFILVAIHSERNTGELYSVFVDRAYRHQGTGSELLKRAESYCRERNCSVLILYTGHSAPAVDFYLHRGFHIVGIRDPRFATKGFDLTLAKELE